MLPSPLPHPRLLLACRHVSQHQQTTPPPKRGNEKCSVSAAQASISLCLHLHHNHQPLPFICPHIKAKVYLPVSLPPRKPHECITQRTHPTPSSLPTAFNFLLFFFDPPVPPPSNNRFLVIPRLPTPPAFRLEREKKCTATEPIDSRKTLPFLITLVRHSKRLFAVRPLATL